MISQSTSKLGGRLVGIGIIHKDGSEDYKWLDKPIHNKIVSGGLDHLLVYNGIDDPNYTQTSSSNYINLYSWNSNNSSNPRKGVLSFAQYGTDGSPTQFTDTDLKAPIGSKSKSYKSGAPFSGTNVDANGYNLRVSYILPESSEDTTVREFAIFGSIKSEAEFPMFARVVLDQPLYLQVGDKPIFTYDLRVDRAVDPVYGDFFGLESADGSPLKFGRKLNYSYYSNSGPYSHNVYNSQYIGTSGYASESSEAAIERPPYYLYNRITWGYYDRPHVSNSDKSFGVSADSLTSIGDVTGDHGFSFVPYTGVGTNDKYRDIIYTMGLLNPGIVNATDYYDIYFMRIRGMDYRFGYYEEDGTTWHPQALRKFGNQILKFTFRTRYVTEDTVQ